MRKSIFDIAAQSICLFDEATRLQAMATQEKIIIQEDNFLVDDKKFTLFQFVDKYCFSAWKQRGHYLNVDDFLQGINYVSLAAEATHDSESLLLLIELYYNFWALSYNYCRNHRGGNNVRGIGNYTHLKRVMDDILDQYNHVARIDMKNECVLVIENRPEVSAAAEIVPEGLSQKILKYNHRSLKGEIDLKKEILVSLGLELEAKRKLLKEIDSKLEDGIFMMLNKLNLRHNNCDIKDKAHYIEFVATMPGKQLEEWYDELYQMMLLAFLQLDNQDRMKHVKDLKANLSGERID